MGVDEIGGIPPPKIDTAALGPPVCRYPGCERPSVPPSVYCDLERHNPSSADQKRRRDARRAEREQAKRLLEGETSGLLDGTLLLHEVIGRGRALSGDLAQLASEIAGAITRIGDPGALDEALEAVREQARHQVADAERARAEAVAAARQARVEANRAGDHARQAHDRAQAAARAATQADHDRETAEQAARDAADAVDAAAREVDHHRETAELAGRRAAAAEASLAELRGELQRATTNAQLAEDRAARQAAELADTRERLHAAERDAARHAERGEQLEAELADTRKRTRELVDAQQRAAAAVAAAEGRAAALAEERDALRAELRDARQAAETDRHEARHRLEQLTQAISAAPASHAPGSA
jgi:chromosome segregation ATPase